VSTERDEVLRSTRAWSLRAGCVFVGAATAIPVFLRYWVFDSNRSLESLVIGGMVACTGGLIFGLLGSSVVVGPLFDKEARIAFPILGVVIMAAGACGDLTFGPVGTVVTAACGAVLACAILHLALPDVWEPRLRRCCKKCGYDLRYVDHDTCPECGAEVSGPPSEGAVDRRTLRRTRRWLWQFRTRPPRLTWFQALAGAAVIGLVIMAPIVYESSRSHFTPGRFDRVWIGMSKKQVVELLGPPDVSYQEEDGTNVWSWTPGDAWIYLMIVDYSIYWEDDAVAAKNLDWF
jgi:hypothetical protein